MEIRKDRAQISGAPNVYFGPGGIRCGTLWFKNTAHARKFFAKYGEMSGQDSGLCKKCRCHYSSFSKEYGKYPDHACQEWKKRIVKEI